MNHELHYTGRISDYTEKYKEVSFVNQDERRKHFIILYQKLYLPIYYFAKSFVSPQDAEDITADSFLKLWSSDLDYTILPKVRTWLNVCTRNACLDLLRNKKAEALKHADFVYLALATDEDILESEIREELLERLDNEIEKLPPQCKRVFKMAYLDGQTSKEIASILHISENTVSNHRVRAFQLLRLAFKSYTYLLLVLTCTACQFFAHLW